MSWAILDAPTILPSLFLTGEIVRGDYNLVAVLVLPDSLEMFDALAASNSRQYRAFFILPVLRNNNRNRLAYGLFGSTRALPRRSIPGLFCYILSCGSQFKIEIYLINNLWDKSVVK